MVTFYDSTRPSLIPAGANACLYKTGPFAVTDPCVIERLGQVLSIDVTAEDPAGCSILDVETGDATPDDVVPWAKARRAASPPSPIRLYCNLSTWPAVKAQVRTFDGVDGLGVAARKAVRYWIANPTGSPHLVPGAAATQWGWFEDYDQSLAHPRWY